MERLACIDDFEVVYSIYMDEQNNPFMTFEIMSRDDFLPIFQQMLAASDLYVYEICGEVAAVYRIIRKQFRISHIAYFGSFAMHPAYRGRGNGRRVMLDIVERLKVEGVKRLELVVVCDNERAIRFYRELGFEVEGTLKCFLKRTNSDEYLDDLMMAKIIG